MNIIVPVQEQGGSGGTSIIGNTSIPVTQGGSFQINVPNGVTVFQGSSPWVSSVPAGVSVLNFPASQGVTFGSVSIGNTLFSVDSIPGGVSVLNFPASQGVTFGSVTVGNTLFTVGSIPGGVTVFPGATFNAFVTNFPSVQAVTGPISVVQGSSWLINVPNGVTAFQGSSPWIVAQSASLTVYVGSTVFVAQGGSFQVDVPNGATVFQGTTLWGVQGKGGSFSAQQGSSWLVNVPNGVTIFQGSSLTATVTQGGSWNSIVTQGSSWLINLPNGATIFQGSSWIVNVGNTIPVSLPPGVTVIQGSSWLINVPNGVTAFQGTTNWMVSTKAPLTPSGASLFTVGTTGVQIAAANATRGGLLVRNLSSTGIASLTFGTTGLVGVGTVLYPGEPWWMDEYCYTIGSVYLINSVAGGTFSSQEYTE